MIVLLHSATGAGTLRRDLGLCEYSYYFVLKEFRPVLERLGLAVAVSDPQHEADEVLRQCRARGEDCVLFSFAPPHKTVVGLTCPTVPVFAWEFDSLPDETWADETGYEDPRNDWRYGLGRLGWAITHSGHAAEATRRAMGDDFPVAVIPAPVWDRFAALPCPPAGESRGFTVEGRVLDTRALDLAPYASSLRRLHGYAPLPPSGEAVRAAQAGGVGRQVERACVEHPALDREPSPLARRAAGQGREPVPHRRRDDRDREVITHRPARRLGRVARVRDRPAEPPQPVAPVVARVLIPRLVRPRLVGQAIELPGEHGHGGAGEAERRLVRRRE